MLSLVFRGARARTNRPVSPSFRRPFVPRVDVLEDRTVPATLTVTNLNAAGPGSLGQAILDAESAAYPGADVISFAPSLKGTLALGGPLTLTGALTIDGPASGKVSIDGGGSGRLFSISPGATVAMSHLTLTGGSADRGGAIYNAGTLSLSDDTLSANVARGAAGGGNAFGGALFNAGGVVAIDRCTFTGNQALGGDGGTGGQTITLPDGTTVGLLGVAGGGAAWNDGGAQTVTRSAFTGNRAVAGDGGDNSTELGFPAVGGTAFGGALGSGNLFAATAPTLSLTGSVLADNQAVGGDGTVGGFYAFGLNGGGFGGAIETATGAATIADSTISGNCATGGNNGTIALPMFGITVNNVGAFGQGAGVDSEADFIDFPAPEPAATLSLARSVLSDNVAVGGEGTGNGQGGGLNASGADVVLTDCTVRGNQALGGVGGMVVSFGAFSFTEGGGGGIGAGLQSIFGSLTMTGVTVSDNLGRGGAAGSGPSGGFAQGGGVYSELQTLHVANCLLSGNRAVSGDGGSPMEADGGGMEIDDDLASLSGVTFRGNVAQGGTAGPGGDGGLADSGALWVGSDQPGSYTSLQMTGCNFIANQALGGPGGAGGNGGNAWAGAVGLAQGTTATLTDAHFVGNLAQGGRGGSGGNGGDALGGALLNSSGATATVQGSGFFTNAALGGAGGAGGSGGNARGGAIANLQLYDQFGVPTSSSLTVVDCNVSGNLAGGGAGVSGGNGQGGGLYLGAQGTTTIKTSLVTGNAAAATAGGRGEGGGIYIDPLATACADALTKAHLNGNHTTGAGDDLFGVLGDCP
jgi:hypothetical protein